MVDYSTIQSFLVALLAGYLLGSIPFAHLAGKYWGVNVFHIGSRSAGTANVFWNIGRGTGVAVLVGDLAKGSAAIVIAGLLDLPWPLTLLVGGAAILGHWNSVFSRFRGGDGMAALMGVTITLEPAMAGLGLLIGTGALLLLWRSSLRGLGALSTCFLVILGASQYYQIDRHLVLGLMALAMLVLFHSMASRRVRSGMPDEEGALELGLASDEESDLGTPSPENR